MSYLPWLTGISALAPLCVLAQSVPFDRTPQGGGVIYESVFANSPRGVEKGATDWRAANDAVGQFRRGHMDVLKWEAAQAPLQSEHAAPEATQSSGSSTTGSPEPVNPR